MQPNLYLFFCLLLGLCSSCNNQSIAENEEMSILKPVDTLSYEVVEKKIKKEQQAEIYRIKNKAVIFFMIDRQEAKRLAKELGDSYRWETDMLFNGFLNQTKEFTRLIRKHNIKSELVFNSKFQVFLDDSSSILFDREKEDQIMGEILTDGKKKPLIEYGMYPHKELAALVQDFFEIENLGYVSPDTSSVPEKLTGADSLTTERSNKEGEM